MSLRKVLIFGARDWQRIAPIRREVRRLVRKHGTGNLLIIEGGAPGADQLAAIAGRDENVHVAEILALWETRYRAAGPQRNEIMRLLEPAEAIGFHEDIAKSKGTKDMKRRLDKASIPVKMVTK